MILIYVHKLTPRIKYIFKTIFTDVLQVNISFTSDCKEFENHEGVKINYSDSKLSSGIFFQATTLLFETKIQKQDIIISEYENKPCFYSVDNESILPFDPFAASFYLISRYEEYLPHTKDEHRRFLANESLAFQHDFLEEPLVNLWTTKITRLITLNYPEFDIPQHSAKTMPPPIAVHLRSPYNAQEYAEPSMNYSSSPSPPMKTI